MGGFVHDQVTRLLDEVTEVDPGPDVDRDDPGYLAAVMTEPEAPAPHAERAYMAWADQEARAA